MSWFKRKEPCKPKGPSEEQVREERLERARSDQMHRAVNQMLKQLSTPTSTGKAND